jgi:hypothetical protein
MPGPEENNSAASSGEGHAEGLVSVYLNGELVRMPPGNFTTEALKKKLEVPTDWDLDVMADDGSLRQLKPGEHTKIIPGMKFVSHVRQGGSS